MYVKVKCCFLKKDVDPKVLEEYGFKTLNEGKSYWLPVGDFNFKRECAILFIEPNTIPTFAKNIYVCKKIYDIFYRKKNREENKYSNFNEVVKIKNIESGKGTSYPFSNEAKQTNKFLVLSKEDGMLTIMSLFTGESAYGIQETEVECLDNATKEEKRMAQFISILEEKKKKKCWGIE